MTLYHQHDISEVTLHFIVQLKMSKLTLLNVDPKAQLKTQSNAMHLSSKTKAWNLEMMHTYQCIVQWCESNCRQSIILSLGVDFDATTEVSVI